MKTITLNDQQLKDILNQTVKIYQNRVDVCGEKSEITDIQGDTASGLFVYSHCSEMAGAMPIVSVSGDSNQDDEIEKLTPIQYEIVREISKMVQRLGGSMEDLATLGSWGDTLSQKDILGLLKIENA